MKIVVREVKGDNSKQYQDFIFDYEDEANMFYKSLSSYPSSHKWYNVGDLRVTILVTNVPN